VPLALCQRALKKGMKTMTDATATQNICLIYNNEQQMTKLKQHR